MNQAALDRASPATQPTIQNPLLQLSQGLQACGVALRRSLRSLLIKFKRADPGILRENSAIDTTARIYQHIDTSYKALTAYGNLNCRSAEPDPASICNQ